MSDQKPADPHTKATPDSESEAGSFDISNEIKKFQEQSEKFKNDYLYLRAEFENYKRNSIKERSDLIKYGAERVISDVLGVVDNFERALQTKVTAENLPTYIQGVEMTERELKAVLQRHGVSELNCQGAPFDPNTMEALSSEPTNEIPPGHVFRTFKKAYKLHDKVVRTAQVIVAKKPE